jgi:hypothetical protein
MKKLILILILVMAWTAGATFTPTITILPSASVNVGDEVFFTGEHTSYPAADSLTRVARYEWFWGDGYPSFSYANNQSGMSAMHYYMSPGTFNCTLSVKIFTWDLNAGTQIDSVTMGKAIQTITVTGTQPIAGFQVQHSSFIAHTSNLMYAEIPATYQSNTTQLRMTLQCQGLSDTVLFLKTSNLNAEERMVFDQNGLPANTYALVTELLNSGGARITGGVWVDDYIKTIVGAPTVGIDTNNSFSVNGSYFFPVGIFEGSTGTDINKYVDSNTINWLTSEGYYPTHNTAAWVDYVTNANNKGLLAMGPTRGSYDWTHNYANVWHMNFLTDSMASYVNQSKDNAGTFGYSFQDEPQLGGWNQKVYAQTLAAWQYVCHVNDQNHPVGNFYYMYDWLLYYGNAYTKAYNFSSSDSIFGGKKFTQDVIGGDIYPKSYRWHTGLNSATKGAVWNYLEALDSMRIDNKCAPIMLYVQPCQEKAEDSAALVMTNSEVYNLPWLCVIRGAKGISWFQYFQMSATGKWQAMRKFKTDIDKYTNILLGGYTSKTITSSATTPLNRVDAIVRHHGVQDTTYVFSARVTEYDTTNGTSILYKGVEPLKIPCTFSISGLSGTKTVNVLDSTSRTLTSIDGVFLDTFAKNDVHIYAIIPGAAATQYTLTMAGTGTQTPANGAHNYDSSTAVQISHTPVGGYAFQKWTRSATTSKIKDSTANITYDTLYGNATVTAVDTAIPHVTPTYTVTIVNDPVHPGTINPTSGAHSIDSGTVTALSFTLTGYHKTRITASTSAYVVFNTDSSTFYPKNNVTLTWADTINTITHSKGCKITINR